MRDFKELIHSRWSDGRFVCVGLDIDAERVPGHLPGGSVDRCLTFLRHVVEATSDLVAAYKPNAAFYEAFGAEGPRLLKETIAHIRAISPRTPVIVDAKRADISSSNNGSVAFLFDYLGADGTTVHPYLGHEAIRPFLDRPDKGIFVLCRTSNPGAAELQDLPFGGEPLFLHVANLVRREWNFNGNCGLVVGATYPKELSLIRERAPDLPLLIPGIGAQGGDMEATVRAACADRRLDALINASRSVLYASDGVDFAEAARQEVVRMGSAITATLSHVIN